MSGKIGMCCACGYDCDKRKSVMHNGFEYCYKCAEMFGLDGDEEEEDDDTNN